MPDEKWKWLGIGALGGAIGSKVLGNKTPIAKEGETQPLPANIVLSNLQVTPLSISPGGTVTVTIEAINVGELKGTADIYLITEYSRQTKKIELVPNQEMTVSFSVRASNEEGLYLVIVNGIRTTYMVQILE